VEEFEFDLEEPQKEVRTPKVKSPEIIADSKSYVVINKPAGLLSIPDRYGVDIPNVEAFLRKKFGEIFVVHRLDKETSGVMVFAKTPEAHKILSMAFENREVKKTYIAIVDGAPVEKEGEIVAPISEDPQKAGKMKIDQKNGKESTTKYRIIERFRKFSLLELNPETGRQHQIRIHCAFIGHPLCVDALYGKRKELFLSEFKRGYKGEEEKPILGRLALHAQSLSFPDPDSGSLLTYEVEIPKDMRATLKQLRQHDCV
jgi:RluA family pseudouridine synthase